MKRLVTRKRVLFFLASYFALSVVGGIALVEISLRPPTLRPVNETAFERASEIARAVDGTVEEVSIDTRDGVTLKAWLIEPSFSRANGDAALVLHGVSDSRVGALGFAPFLLERGYTVLLPDARAHGQSGGLATYGLLEREDVHAWTRLLHTRLAARGSSPSPACLYGFGASMGAAMQLQSLSEGSRDFCAVAVDSPFSDFKEIAFDRVGQPFGVGEWFGRTVLRPLVEIAFLYGEWKYGLDLQNASPSAALAGSSVPVLLIHGEADYNIPLRHAHALKAAHPAIEFWSVPGASHTAAHRVAQAEYERRVLAWFARHKHTSSRSN